MHHGTLARLHALAHQAAEVVHCVEEGIAQVGHLGLDIAWHSEVDQEHGPVTALLQGALDRAHAEDGQGAGRAAHHNVELMELIMQAGECHGLSTVLARQGLTAGHGSIGHHDAHGPLGAEVRQAEVDHLARANEQHRGLGEVSEDLLGELHPGRRHRDRVGTNLSGGAHFLGHGEGPLEEVVQVHAQAARLVGLSGGLLQLAQNLGLTEHHGVQATGHAKDMSHGLGLGVLVEVMNQFPGLHLRALCKPGQGLLTRRLGLGRGQVELGAVAGGDQGLLRGRAREHPSQSMQVLPQRVARKGKPFPNRQGRGLVVEAKGKQLHKALILREVVESVADAVHGRESKALVGREAEFLANTGDVGVDGASLHVLVVPPDLEPNLVARHRLAELAQQHLGALEFLVGERHGLPVAVGLGPVLAVGVEPNGPDRPDGLGLFHAFSPPAANACAQASLQFRRAKGLVDIVVCAQCKGLYQACLVGGPSEHDHGRPLRPVLAGPGPMGRKDIQPRHVRQAQVTQNRIEMLAVQGIEQQLAARKSANLPALKLQQLAEL